VPGDTPHPPPPPERKADCLPLRSGCPAEANPDCPCSWHDEDTDFFIDIDTPASGKNRRQLVWIGGKPRLIKSKEANRTAKHTRSRAIKAMAKRDAPVHPTDDVEVVMRYYVAEERCTVSVRSLRPRPKGRTGRKRDLSNLPDVVLDAIQGFAYANDNQVARLIVERIPI